MCSSDPRPQSVGGDTRASKRRNEAETVQRQEALNVAYGSWYERGYDTGYEAGVKAEVDRRQKTSDTEEAYTQGFAAGQRRLMNSEIAFAFAKGQQVERERIRTHLEKGGDQTTQAREILEFLRAPTESSEPVRRTVPPSASTPDVSVQQSRQYSSRGSEISHASPTTRLPEDASASDVIDSPLGYSHQSEPQKRNPAPASEWATKPRRRTGRPRLHEDGEGRHALATCVFCGVQLSQNSILRHKRRQHPAELAAVGVPLRNCACWWPGCGQLQDNYVHNQLTTHLQRKHNFSPPGDSNAYTENIKYMKRMPIDLQISIIAEAAQQLNAVKLRIQDLEARLRRLRPSYASRHGLPDPHQLHESRLPVLSAALMSRGRLPYMIQELRQLTRARGMRSQVRSDEGTWWEVADDLEAGLDPSGRLARAVAALPPPGDGPTVHLNPNTFFEAPNMNDPSWRPQHVLPLQTGWDVTGPDDNPVWRRVDTGAQRDTSDTAEPAIKREAEDDEEDGGYQELMAEISRRVLDDRAQSDWDQSSSDEDGEDSGGRDDRAVHDWPDQSDARTETQQRKRPASTTSPPRTIKHRRAS